MCTGAGKPEAGFARPSRAINRSTGTSRVVEMKEYDILLDTGTARKLVEQINRMAKEGWQAKSIGLGALDRSICVLMEREVG